MNWAKIYVALQRAGRELWPHNPDKKLLTVVNFNGIFHPPELC